MVSTKSFVALALASGALAALDDKQVSTLDIIISDIRENRFDYISWIGLNPEVSTPAGLIEVAREISKYTDKSYTTLFDRIDYDGVVKLLPQIPWYEQRLKPRLDSVSGGAPATPAPVAPETGVAPTTAAPAPPAESPAAPAESPAASPAAPAESPAAPAESPAASPAAPAASPAAPAASPAAPAESPAASSAAPAASPAASSAAPAASSAPAAGGSVGVRPGAGSVSHHSSGSSNGSNGTSHGSEGTRTYSYETASRAGGNALVLSGGLGLAVAGVVGMLL